MFLSVNVMPSQGISYNVHEFVVVCLYEHKTYKRVMFLMMKILQTFKN